MPRTSTVIDGGLIRRWPGGGDISDEQAVAAMVGKVEAELGPVSILINCAGGDIGAAGTKPNPTGALDTSLADTMAVIQRN